MSFNKTLQSKGQEYKGFDPKRFPEMLALLPKLNARSVQVLGTNGKGSTSRFIAQALFNKGYKVGHFSSPHILSVRERFWVNNHDASEDMLDNAHDELCKYLSKLDVQRLSYFEYLCALCVFVFSSCEFVVFEAGMGGEFDATTSFAHCLQVFTPISIDHEEVLGHSLEAIASTKLRAIKAKVLLGKQKKSVRKIAKKISQQKGFSCTLMQDLDYKTKDFLFNKEARFIAHNRLLAFLAVKELGINMDKDEMNFAVIFGRLSLVAPNVYVDVGHNVPAAKEIVKFFGHKKVILIYNSFSQKNYDAIIGILKQIVKACHILPVQNERMAPKKEIQKVLKKHKIAQIDIRECDETNLYLVFGSFMLVQEFLEGKLCEK